MNQAETELYRQIPAIERLLQDPVINQLVESWGKHLVVASLRELQRQARDFIAQNQRLPDWHGEWVKQLKNVLTRQMSPSLRGVLNLSGTVLHTNLGRAVLAESAINAVTQVMRQPVTLEYDVDSGGRGHRDRAVSELITQLTGADAACIVNNNAAAVLLMLAATSTNKEVIVSRGELVEIGGAFRIPDVMRQAGCLLVEVGTTNRTYLRDYQKAISENTALLMKVHTSNYVIQGFVHSVTEEELVQLGKEKDIPVAVDLGSGSLVDLSQYGLPAEPMPQNLIAAGVDLVCFSGDKLLGGPQAGIIIGRQNWIDKIQQHPLKRALRADKMTLAALEATLRLYLRPDKLKENLPTWRLLSRTATEILQLAERLLPIIQSHYSDKFNIQIEPCHSQIGSGSLPQEYLQSYAITLAAKDGRGSTLDALMAHWRKGATPIIGRIQEGKIWLDFRCLLDEHAFIEELSQ